MIKVQNTRGILGKTLIEQSRVKRQLEDFVGEFMSNEGRWPRMVFAGLRL